MDKQKLRQYRPLYKAIRELQAERQEVLNSLLAPPPLTGMPHGSEVADPVAAAIAAREKYDKKISEKIMQLVNLRVEIEESIGSLSINDQRLIRLHYVDGHRWEVVAVELNYSIQRVWQKHGDILKNIRVN